MHRPVLIALGLLALAGSSAFAQTPPPGSRPGGGMGPPVERAEVGPWSERLFGRLDANQDGFLTGSELGVLTQGPMGAAGGARLRTVIAQSDASGDSRISPDELAAGVDRMFTRMDRNGDGRLTGDELPQPPAQARPPAVPMPSQPDPMPMPDGMSGG